MATRLSRCLVAFDQRRRPAARSCRSLPQLTFLDEKRGNAFFPRFSSN
jgi:hypothetical protein